MKVSKRSRIILKCNFLINHFPESTTDKETKQMSNTYHQLGQMLGIVLYLQNLLQ